MLLKSLLHFSINIKLFNYEQKVFYSFSWCCAFKCDVSKCADNTGTKRLPTANGAYSIGKLVEGANSGLFQLKDEASGKVLSMDEDGVLSLVASSSTSTGLANTLWCVTVSSENQGQAPKFDFMNKGTGRMLDITMAEILKSESQVDLTPTTGGEIAGGLSLELLRNWKIRDLCSLTLQLTLLLVSLLPMV